MPLFTSESVTEGHPDKLADQISDGILDAILARDPLARVACETAVTTGLVTVMGEITTDTYVDIPRIIRQTVREVGYTRAKYGFDSETCGVMVSIDELLVRLRRCGAQLVGEVVQYEEAYRLCYIRGPEGLLIGLAEELKSK